MIRENFFNLFVIDQPMSEPVIAHHPDQRARQARRWFTGLSDYSNEYWHFDVLCSDASFRRYFRLSNKRGMTLILLDSPPDTEPIDAFITIGTKWSSHTIDVPAIIAFDTDCGFALLEDLGDRHLEKISDDQFHQAYTKAIAQIIQIQHIDADALPTFNAAHITRELSIMPDWTLPLFNLQLQPTEMQELTKLFHWLEHQITGQPYTTIHRDYHCRNLMVIGDRLAIIDFQGAMYGPYCYDIVSLTTDVYHGSVTETAQQLQQQYLHMSAFADRNQEQFSVDCASVQLQRHIKILGLFCRLYTRDGKSQYMHYVPLVCQHITKASEVLATTATELRQSLAILNGICQKIQGSYDRK